MAMIKNAAYQDVQVTVDGQSYQDCSFRNVTLVFTGGDLPTFENCTFEAIQLDFGAAADNTLLFLSGLYEGGFANSVEAIFDAIRTRRTG